MPLFAEQLLRLWSAKRSKTCKTYYFALGLSSDSPRAFFVYFIVAYRFPAIDSAGFVTFSFFLTLTNRSDFREHRRITGLQNAAGIIDYIVEKRKKGSLWNSRNAIVLIEEGSGAVGTFLLAKASLGALDSVFVSLWFLVNPLWRSDFWFYCSFLARCTGNNGSGCWKRRGE